MEASCVSTGRKESEHAVSLPPKMMLDKLVPMAKKRRLLLRIEGCPYCQRAEAALDEAGVAYEKFEVDRRDRTIVQALSGQPSVPVLVEVIGCESQDDDIVAAIPHLKG